MTLLSLWMGCAKQGPSSEAFNDVVGPSVRVVDVDVLQQSDGSATLSVSILSDETGCDQYADWWEVVDAEGELLYRRILDHSHPDEQPFTRSGSAFDVDPEQEVIVRAHMNPGGYGTDVFQGKLDSLVAVTVEEGLYDDLQQQQPLPSGCAF